MKARTRYLIAAVLATSAFMLLHGLPRTAAANQSNKARRAVEQRRIAETRRQNLDLNNLRSSHINDARPDRDFDMPIIADAVSATGYNSSSAAVPPPPSPGIPLAVSTHDCQHNDSQGYQTARTPGADIVHFVWMAWDRIPTSVDDNDRYVAYQSYTISTNTLNQGFGGVYITGVLSRGGYPGGDVFDNNTFQTVLHKRADVSVPYSPWRLNFTTPGSAAHVDDQLSGYGASGCAEVLWPRVATSRAGTRSVHVLAHSNTNDCPVDLLWYWRHNGTTWTGPIIIDSTPQLSYVLADEESGNKVAVVVNVSNHTSMNGMNNVAYMESTTDGAGWIAGTETITKNVITNYGSANGPQAWLHLTTAYDHDGVLHIVYDEQIYANIDSKTALRHWNSQRQTVRMVALADWDTPYLTGVFNLNLAKITMGIGDGSTLCQGGAQSNEDYLYVLYTRFGGPTPQEEADHSRNGYYNGELYLSASTSGGNSWSFPVNLTNTKTPGCNTGGNDSTYTGPRFPDSVCRSEHWATIGMAVSDIDIIFISDLDAGGIPQGEGSWQLNPVHYLRIPGGTTNAQHLCPLTTANFEATLTTDTECERNTGQNGVVIETLQLMNLGNGDLSGEITVTDFSGLPTLTVSGSNAYSIIDGGPDDFRTVTMSANGAPEGLYSGSISISHNDPNEPSPREFPIALFIFNEFFCPQYAAMRTGVASPGSLQLGVSNDGRFGLGAPEMGMWRHKDSSSSLDEASLLVAHGPQGPDTTVFLRFGTRASNGQGGLRAIGDLVVDTLAYGTGNGCATASSKLVTADSVVGISIEWQFPQDPMLDEFIVARLNFYRHNTSVPVTNLAIGILADFDILPASRMGAVQSGVTNEAGSDGTRNLIWVRGVDSIGHPISGQTTATRFRGGIMVPDGFEGSITGNHVSDIAPGGGPSDGFLYFMLQSLAGIDLYSVSDTDMYAMISIDKGRSIAVGETLSYTMILLSDTISEASLKATADLALANYQSLCPFGGDGCPCWADPQCDGIRSNVQDVVMTINVAFRGIPPVIDVSCPNERTDVDASGFTDVQDVIRVVNVAFRGQSVASQYVHPLNP